MADFKFCETDARAIENSIFALCEEFMRLHDPNFKLAAGSPLRLFCEAMAAIETQRATITDLTGKANLLEFVGEENIENLVRIFGRRAARLQAAAAATTVKYTLVTPLEQPTTITAGSRVTASTAPGLFFATAEDLVIPSGEVTGEVRAVCETLGKVGNGFAPGEINTMVERRNPFVLSVVNITESGGGTDKEGLEEYRARMFEVLESFSVAGPDGAYEFWAKSANAGIIDVRAWQPPLDLVFFKRLLAEMGVTNANNDTTAQRWLDRFYELVRETGTGPGNVNVAVLMGGGELPPDEVKQEVFNVLSDETVRPLTDYVHIVDPEPVEYNINVRYWIGRANVTLQTAIIGRIAEAVEQFRQWQRSKIGRDIVPSELHRAIMNAGARRVEITEPQYRILDKWQVAQDVGVTVSYGGLEDE